MLRGVVVRKANGNAVEDPGIAGLTSSPPGILAQTAREHWENTSPRLFGLPAATRPSP
jgi:hypothetical protein